MFEILVKKDGQTNTCEMTGKEVKSMVENNSGYFKEVAEEMEVLFNESGRATDGRRMEMIEGSYFKYDGKVLETTIHPRQMAFSLYVLAKTQADLVALILGVAYGIKE